MRPFKLEALVEAILFAASEPVPLPQLAQMLDLPQEECLQVLEDYGRGLEAAERGITLRPVAGGWQVVTKPELAQVVGALGAPRRYRLSKPTVETLAIIAYQQPVTRAEIEAVRGVKSERALATLLERNLIVEAGRKDTVGRPILYATSTFFLEYFGLASLEQLPLLDKEL